MEVIPAIDLRQGAVVRLEQGDFARETVYGTDPALVARRWVDEGARRIHVVNLEGAAYRRPGAASLLSGILGSVSAETVVEVGGGFRSFREVESLLVGDRRLKVVLGTSAVVSAVLEVADLSEFFAKAGRRMEEEVPERDILERAIGKYADRTAVAIDARDGGTAVCGWQVVLPVSPVEVARRLAASGVRELVYTDIVHDGTLRGPNLAATTEIALSVRVPVIASGGIGSLDDVRRVAQLEQVGVHGMIVGRALYAGRFNLTEAIAAASG